MAAYGVSINDVGYPGWIQTIFDVRINDVGTWRQLVQMYAFDNPSNSWKPIIPLALLVTTGASGPVIGYSSGGFGSVSFDEFQWDAPSSGGFNPADALTAAFSQAGGGGVDFLVRLAGAGITPPVDRFTTVYVEDHNGTIRGYDSATATTSVAGFTRTWQWGSGSNLVYNTGGQQRIVAFR